jgi:hypothetical protein
MTAQQQLVELMRNTDNRAGAWQFEAQHWIRDHGPVVDRMLSAYSKRKQALAVIQSTEFSSAARAVAIQDYDAAEDAIAAALKSLTEPK